MESGMGSIFERRSIDEQWIVFRILDRKYAIEARSVKEILSIVPFNPSFLGGAGFFASFPLRGSLIYAFDLRYYWGEQPKPYHIEDNLLLLDNHIAIPVQEIIEIKDLNLTHSITDGSESVHLIKAELVENDFVVSLLDSQALLNLNIESTELADSTDPQITKQKMNWFEISTSNYSELDNEILSRRKQAYESIESIVDSGSMIALAVLESVNEIFCLPIDQILEFSEPGQITPIPSSLPELHGCMNLRGEVIPVLSLAALMGKNRKYSFTEGKIILVKEDSYPIGILVDELLDVVYRKSNEKVLTNINSKFSSETFNGSLIEASYPDFNGNHLNQISLELIFSKAKSVLQ
ncbi:MAG: chemotaxis protein CheW [Leptospiraceae bacterium]|nr:chemotaxis protein CheW [Leptospiraceae bacterium]